MKKYLLLFFLFLGLNSANAQLEFYQFMFNIYDNGERIRDSRKFDAALNIYDREKPDSLLYFSRISIGDTAKNLGYDYNIFKSGDLFFERTGEILIIKEQTDTMKIILDNPKASAWTSIGIDKLYFKTGTFKVTEENWPQKVRARYWNNRTFNYIDENFDWENVRQK